MMKYNTGMQVCLSCMSHRCGRGENKHALQHYNESSSDQRESILNKHHMTIHSRKLSVWCYACDEDFSFLVEAMPSEVKEKAVSFMQKI